MQMFALSNTRSPAVITHKAAEAKFCQYPSKSVASLPENGRAGTCIRTCGTRWPSKKLPNAWCFMVTDQCESVRHRSVGPIFKGRTQIGSPLHKLNPIRQNAMSLRDFQILLLTWHSSWEKIYIPRVLSPRWWLPVRTRRTRTFSDITTGI